MNNLVEAYIDDHKTAWAESTLKSELARLRRLDLSLAPEALFKQLQGQGKKAYTIKTTFIRVCALERWAKFEPRFAQFMEKHGRRFKFVYEKEQVQVTYEEAEKRIMGLEGRSREHALGLLRSGVRLTESYNVRDGQVKGKGGKTRKVYGTIKETEAKSSFARKLKAVGLKPHTLRKLCATRLAEKGATPADLCKIFGWSSIETAYQYLQAQGDERLGQLMEACKTER